MAVKQQAEQIAKELNKACPSPKTELIHANEYQLVVAVMLSAQTTDKKVNQVTPEFFKKYPSWDALAHANLADVQKAIYGVNFYLGKADRLIRAAKTVLAEFHGELPHTLEKLIKIQIQNWKK